MLTLNACGIPENRLAGRCSTLVSISITVGPVPKLVFSVSLILVGRFLDDQQVEVLADALKELPVLRKLDLRGNDLTDRV